MRRTLREPISRPAWQVLVSFGLAMLMITGLLSYWNARSDREQERDMCAVFAVFLSGPEPQPGLTGERSRVVRKAMGDYYEKRHCDQVLAIETLQP